MNLYPIFYSGNFAFSGDREALRDITFLIEEKYLAFEEIVIASKADYLKLLDEELPLETEGGSMAHRALKVLGMSYLAKVRNLPARYEHPFCGHYPDVLADDHSIAIECGHTHNAEKMLTYFQQSNLKECVQIPYPDADSSEVLGYRFIGETNLQEFLKFLRAERNQELKIRTGRFL